MDIINKNKYEKVVEEIIQVAKSKDKVFDLNIKTDLNIPKISVVIPFDCTNNESLMLVLET